ncbi:MAG: thermonuclease family protein [Burkholderiaceae bacterium]|nr:thermonuclease family protein [Burkholderiaceae bacterium]
MSTRAVLLLTIALLGLPCQADLISGRVVSVADGDTITVLDGSNVQHKIRLAGIDAPEKSQAFGQRSRESLAELVAKRAVIIETNKQDRYGRYVGKVLVDGQDMNVEQIRRGLAWFYRQYEQELSDSDRQRYDRAESDARESRRGLWADIKPVAPWDFRAKERLR